MVYSDYTKLRILSCVWYVCVYVCVVHVCACVVRESRTQNPRYITIVRYKCHILNNANLGKSGII